MSRAAAAPRRCRIALGFAVVSGILAALVPSFAVALLVVNAPWVRPGSADGTTEAYMTLTSTDGAALVGVASEIAAVVILSGDGKGKQVERLPLPAGAAIMLKPGERRLRLLRLTRALKLGDRVPLTLTIEAADGSRQQIPVDGEVRRRSPIDDHRHGHAH